MSVNPIPADYPRITPYLVVNKAAPVIEFLQKAFDATEKHRTQLPDGRIMHVEMRIAGAPVMIGEAHGDMVGRPASMYLFMEDCDAAYQRALKAGGESIMEPADQFYGDRHGGVTDPQGNSWWIATRVEDVSPEEMERRSAEMIKNMCKE